MRGVSEGRQKEFSAGGWAREKVGEFFGADLRSLAAFRIALALLVLADLLNRARDLTADYTDFGVTPRVAINPVPNEQLFPQGQAAASP